MLGFLNGFAASRDLLLIEPGCPFALQSLSPVKCGSPRYREALALQKVWVHIASDPKLLRMSKGGNRHSQAFWWDFLNQEHVSVFWLVLAQWWFQDSGYPLLHAALLHAADTEGYVVCFQCRELYKTQWVVLPCPSHHVDQGKDLFLSFVLVSLVRELWRQSPSIFHCAWALGKRSA